MTTTAAMLAARLALVDRVRVVELELARGEQARLATEVLRQQIHALGNAVQIVDLGSQELARRDLEPASDLVDDIRAAAIDAAAALRRMIALAKPEDRTIAGPPVAPAVRAAVELARPAVAAELELRVALDDRLASLLTAPELEALVLAAILDATAASRITLDLHARTIADTHWIELVRQDDRSGPVELDVVPPSFAGVVDGIARVAGGEVSLAPGRTGHELAIALPVA